jgi:N-acyl-D-amino-acid deacylase
MKTTAGLMLACCVMIGSAAARDFDLIIRKGTVIDGTGAARRVTDIGIVGDTIVAVGNLAGSKGKTELAVPGLVVTPGFIDMHAHLDREEGLLSKDVRRRAAQNYVGQGITSAAINPDGRQPPSLLQERRDMEKAGIGVNVALFNGHNALRAMVMNKDEERPATKEEIEKMKAILRRGLEQEGSFGLSLGVEYYSGQYATADELVDLASVLPAYGGIYTSHLRSQGISPMWYKPSVHKNIKAPTLEDSLKETIRVAEETGATTVVTHMKGWGPGYRGEAKKWIEVLQASRNRGAKLFMDVYSFDSTGSDGDFVLLPPWSMGGRITARDNIAVDYRANLKSALEKSSSALADLEIDVEHQVALKGGPSSVVVLEYKDPSYVGKTLAELMKLRKMNATELAIALQNEGDPNKPGGVKMRALSLDEKDVEAYYAQPWAATSTDGWVVLPEEAVGPLKYLGTNRRCFGTYPRRLALISQEHKVDSLEEAIRKSTSLPAEILNLPDRGRIAPGMKADIVVLDMATLQDNTTVAEPNVYPSGVQHVYVNGVAAVKDGQSAGRHRWRRRAPGCKGCAWTAGTRAEIEACACLPGEFCPHFCQMPS